MLRKNRNRKRLKRCRSDKLLIDLRRLQIEESLEDEEETILEIPNSQKNSKKPCKILKEKQHENLPLTVIDSIDSLRNSQIKSGFKKKRKGKENIENQNSIEKGSNSKNNQRKFKFLKDLRKDIGFEEIISKRKMKIKNVDFYNRSMVRELHTTNNFLAEKIVRSAVENRYID